MLLIIAKKNDAYKLKIVLTLIDYFGIIKCCLKHRRVWRVNFRQSCDHLSSADQTLIGDENGEIALPRPKKATRTHYERK